MSKFSIKQKCFVAAKQRSKKWQRRFYLFWFSQSPGGGVFAQISFKGDVSTLNLMSTTPSLGIGIGLEKFDVLSGVGFSAYSWGFSNGNDSYSVALRCINIYAGIAPKVPLSENWSLSFPLLAQVSFDGNGKLTVKYSDGSEGREFQNSLFALSFRTGGRVDYAISGHWGVYIGFLWDVIVFTQTKYETFENNDIILRTADILDVFPRGVIQLGISYKF
jgi:hypothetical protein